MLHRFRDRAEAGYALADVLASRDLADPVVLALPRGGVPVAAAIADRLQAPLDVFVARKIGAPSNPELAIGAIAEGGPATLRASASRLGLDRGQLDDVIGAERRELARRVQHYRGDRPLPPCAGRTVVLVDDGIATGATAEAALRALRALGPAHLVLAVPVCAPDADARLERIADEVVAVHVPAHFRAVGQWYEDFSPTTDDEVMRLLGRAHAPHTS